MFSKPRLFSSCSTIKATQVTQPEPLQLSDQLRSKYQTLIKEKHDQQVTELYHRFALLDAAYKKTFMQAEPTVQEFHDGSWRLCGPSIELINLIGCLAKSLVAVHLAHAAIYQWSEQLSNLELMLSINQDESTIISINKLQDMVTVSKVQLNNSEAVFWRVQGQIDNLQYKFEPLALCGENSVINRCKMLYDEKTDPLGESEMKSRTRPRFIA